jgi:hypothetical protein
MVLNFCFLLFVVLSRPFCDLLIVTAENVDWGNYFNILDLNGTKTKHKNQNIKNISKFISSIVFEWRFSSGFVVFCVTV